MTDQKPDAAFHEKVNLPVTNLAGMKDRIEILSVQLLDQNRRLVEDLKIFAQSLRIEFGWHYLLDLTWIISQLGDVKNMHIMDAGSGTGILQWYLAEKGALVVSVDRSSRANLPLRFRRRFQVAGLRSTDLNSPLQTFRASLYRGPGESTLRGWVVRLLSQTRDLASSLSGSVSQGDVRIYNQDLVDLADIADESLDAVVALSSLEHNPLEVLSQVIAEIMRILKPGGALLATLVAARDQDWWHAPSSAWCYTEASLQELFDISPAIISNYDQYDQLFSALRDNEELRNDLAGFYSKSGDNGMPWGKWDPQYQPVGICKIKTLVTNHLENKR